MDKSPFLAMPREQQRSALEAILFASDDALSSRALYKLLVEADEQAARQEQEQAAKSDAAPEATGETADAPEAAAEPVVQKPQRQAKAKDLTGLFEALVTEINEELESTGRAFTIVRVAGGYQFATTAVHGELVARLVKSKSKRRLSQAALETLAIIAYRQPITKPEIESIRGVSCNEVVNTLLEKNLVTIAGRSDAIGKPLLYGTTEEFLRSFGLHDVSDLPKPRELEELMERRADILNSETVVFAENEGVEEFEERLHNIGKKMEEEEAGDSGLETGRETTEEQTHEEPTHEEPAQEEPAHEEPATESEPMAEQPAEQPRIAEQEPAEAKEEEPEAEAPAQEQPETAPPAEESGRKMRMLMTMNGR